MVLVNHVANEKKEIFHNKHERFTEIAYNTPNLLPDRYVFILTNLCNLRCSFCFQKKDLKKNVMTAKDWISLTRQIPDYARVTLCGGEPLLFRGFKEVFSFVANKFDCNIITNGILLTEDTIDYILSFPKFKVLSLSIDNIGNTIRGVTSIQWERLKIILKYFVKKRNKTNTNCMLDIKTLLLDENADNLFESYKYFMEELNADTHAFQFLKGSPIQHADYMYEFDDILRKSRAQIYEKFDLIKEQLNYVRQYNMQKGKISFLHPKVESLVSNKPFSRIDFLNKTNYVKDLFLPCKFPWSSVHINFDGTLFPCLAISMGNVKEKSLSDIINGEKYNRFKDIIKKEGTVEACNRCGWLRLKD